ncbi:gamma-glutamylcyclotransferase, partial [Elysia marginata]
GCEEQSSAQEERVNEIDLDKISNKENGSESFETEGSVEAGIENAAALSAVASQEETVSKETSKESVEQDSSKTDKGVKNKKEKINKDSFKCNVCQRGHQTRNKLFDHIKQTGHALRVDQPQPEVEEERTGKRGKKNKKDRR